MLTCGFALLGLAAWFGLLRCAPRPDAEPLVPPRSIDRPAPRHRRHGSRLDRHRGRRQPSIVWAGCGRRTRYRRQWRRCSLLAVAILYLVLGIATIVVLRAMSRRWNDQTISASDLPYGPPAMTLAESSPQSSGWHDDLRDLRRRRLRGGPVGPPRQQRPARGSPARPDRPSGRAGLGGEPHLADLRPRDPVVGLPGAFAAITSTLYLPLALAAVGIVLRAPASRSGR